MTSYFDESAVIWLTAVALIVASVVFIRACWAHRRESRDTVGLKPWLILGAVVIAVWAGVAAIELATESTLDLQLHYVCIASGCVWLVITLGWALGRITSRVLRRLERARAIA
ncbi:hypothetical protein ENSA5_08240 [Enhygromyxa salina]|uniref:Transmembrane protein n=1 Tax=Enhygromyxa salina TaxID=215803 RepID=A0A2S9YGY1_9BACT|nr:hypothetical protein [Enhygromyxa salina]PRQ04375.1 hypothetical protein ENSA5_08240 [Enhygromyxa salina]